MDGGENMLYDYCKLKGKIIEKFGSQANFAKAMNSSERTISLKMCGKREWKQSDIEKAVCLLGLSVFDIAECFFKQKVKNI